MAEDVTLPQVTPDILIVEQERFVARILPSQVLTQPVYQVNIVSESGGKKGNAEEKSERDHQEEEAPDPALGL